MVTICRVVASRSLARHQKPVSRGATHWLYCFDWGVLWACFVLACALWCTDLSSSSSLSAGVWHIPEQRDSSADFPERNVQGKPRVAHAWRRLCEVRRYLLPIPPVLLFFCEAFLATCVMPTNCRWNADS